jgi:pSer/pThr/pTyr-binding forkhead associated (FHA) protein
MSAQVWTIGSDPSNELVVERPSVSWRHCQLTRRLDGTYLLEDLGSTNGTYVNGVQIRSAVAVRRTDQITLGLTVPLPWPREQEATPPTASHSRVIRIGRDPTNDLVLDNPEVSTFHAVVKIAAGGREGVVEDLGSTNGTAIGAPGKPLLNPTIVPSDMLYFGPIGVPASRFFPVDTVERRESIPDLIFRGPVMTVGRDQTCDRVVDFPVVSSRHARIVRARGVLVVEDLGSSNGTFVNGVRIDKTAEARSGDLISLGSYQLRLIDGSIDEAPGGETTIRLQADQVETPGGVRYLSPGVVEDEEARAETVSGRTLAAAGVALGVQAGVVAGAIMLAAGRANEAALFGLAVAAVWFGVTAALFERLLARASTAAERGRIGLNDVGRSLGRTATLDMALAAVLVMVGTARLPLEGGRLAAFALVYLATLVGSALTLALMRLTDRLVIGFAASVALIAVMTLIGGPMRPLPSFHPIVRTASTVLPSRWAFEALLLNWAGANAENSDSDPVEPFFPAATDRTGTTACVTALLAFLLGAIYVDAIIALARSSRGP